MHDLFPGKQWSINLCSPSSGPFEIKPPSELKVSGALWRRRQKGQSRAAFKGGILQSWWRNAKIICAAPAWGACLEIVSELRHTGRGALSCERPGYRGEFQSTGRQKKKKKVNGSVFSRPSPKNLHFVANTWRHLAAALWANPPRSRCIID